MNRFVEATALLSGKPSSHITGAVRTNDMAQARWIGMAAMRSSGASSVQIGRAFNKDHTSALYAVKKVASDPEMRLKAFAVALMADLNAPDASRFYEGET